MANEGDVFTADSVQLWIMNGNGRAEKLVRSWEESEFQSTLAAQHSKDYEMYVGQYAAVLGARGDWFEIRVPMTGTGLSDCTSNLTGKGHLYVDFMDILGVPGDVQLAKVHGYGKYSPFDSPDLKVTDDMKRGIESERLALVMNQDTVIAKTWVSQYIAGAADARLQGQYEKTHVAGDAAHTLTLRLKPTANNVFMIRYDSRIWVLPATATVAGAFIVDAD